MSAQAPNRPKRPSDPNKLAASIVAQATGETVDETQAAMDAGKDPLAVALGRRGGLKGGPARAASMTKKRRSEIAKKAAAARWQK